MSKEACDRYICFMLPGEFDKFFDSKEEIKVEIEGCGYKKNVKD